ncbi:EpsG family protein [Acinetobacter wuhouensis]|uniref:EpsG family protein n=1 Tax=Acinetobacter wuhouensis TaxID=1879050 RepID=A0A4Q7AIV6_9GAMM|nr:EpsG family protein [Acinetobacter wuhouensis]RZG46419.1 hypothetical protein EXU28_08980 [Acinetobacter wuhouensis]
MKVEKNHIIVPFLLLFTTSLLVFLSLFVFKNPDLDAYIAILNSSNKFSFNIEPATFFLATFANFLGRVFLLDPIIFFYFQYIFLIQLFIFFGFYNLSKNKFILTGFLLVLWLFVYGVLHCLIQIRFGLANAIFLYAFSLLYKERKNITTFVLGVAAFFTHYSSGLAIFSLFLIRLRSVLFNKTSYIIVHGFFITFLLLFKIGSVFSILPSFMFARISGYIDNVDIDQISNISIYMSFVCYFILIVSPKLNDEKLNALKYYGALGFLPYFIVPELEIIVRLGVAFQYLLLPYLILTFKFKKVVFITTLPLLVFFGYKVFSSINTFLGYL